MSTGRAVPIAVVGLADQLGRDAARAAPAAAVAHLLLHAVQTAAT